MTPNNYYKQLLERLLRVDELNLRSDELDRTSISAETDMLVQAIRFELDSSKTNTKPPDPTSLQGTSFDVNGVMMSVASVDIKPTDETNAYAGTDVILHLVSC